LIPVIIMRQRSTQIRTKITIPLLILALIPMGDACTGDATSESQQKHYLLLDDRIIDQTTNAKLEVGQVTKHPGNPLFREENPWEQRFDNLYGNVIFDREESLYKCWYCPFIVDSSAHGMTLEERQERNYQDPPNREMAICYATSRDGIQWEKPQLGLVEYDGSKQNNIIWRGPHGAGVFKDAMDPDTDRRYKTIFQGMAVSSSADGLHWSPKIKCTGVRVAGDTHNNAFWAPTLGKYVGITRTWGDMGREVARIESDDYVNWTKEEVVMKGIDRNLQPYAMPVFFHGGVYLGLVAIHDQEADRVWTELAWSPDTRIWKRISPGTPLIPCSDTPLEYDYGCVYACATPVFLEDEIRLYYGGSDWLHFSWRNGSLCMATLRPDGFAGYAQDSKQQPAVVTTVPLPYSGNRILVSADIEEGGSIKVSIFDRNGNTLANTEVLQHTVTDHPLELDSRIRADEVKLKFEFTGATLYAFNFGEK
jgi:hypothetical protein